MIINGIKLLTLLLQAIEVLSWSLYPRDCGYFPGSTNRVITSGFKIRPERFSWMASLTYGSDDRVGVCGGSVINSRYVLTAAHCVSGEKIKKHGKLTGVRLGDFSEESDCDYGNPGCRSYQHYGIEEIIIHHRYRDGDDMVDNDIALLRLDCKIVFDDILKPVCLPSCKVPEPKKSTILTVAGWGKTTGNAEITKRAFCIPLVTDREYCQNSHDSRMCAGVLSSNEADDACKGEAGGPLMQKRHGCKRMVIEGILSYVQEGCANAYSAPHYTRVRHYLSWIDDNMYIY